MTNTSLPHEDQIWDRVTYINNETDHYTKVLEGIIDIHMISKSTKVS